MFELDLRAPLDSRAPPGASRLPETVADLHFFTQAPHTANQCRYASVGAVLCECLVRVVSHGVQGCADCSESAGERPGSAGVRVVVRSAEVESDVSGKLLNLRGNQHWGALVLAGRWSWRSAKLAVHRPSAAVCTAERAAGGCATPCRGSAPQCNLDEFWPVGGHGAGAGTRSPSTP